MLLTLPPEIYIELRTDYYKMLYFGTLTNPDKSFLQKNQRFDGSDRARIGFFDDCFVSGLTDQGTFDFVGGGSPNDQQIYVANEAPYIIMGGETCNPVDPTYNDCERSKSYLSKFAFTHLNILYCSAVISYWKSNECYNEITNRLGYRFSLISFSVSYSASAGTLTAQGSLVNNGFAGTIKQYNVELVVINGGVKSFQFPNVDTRKWLPYSKISLSSSFPATLNQGTNQFFS